MEHKKIFTFIPERREYFYAEFHVAKINKK